MRRTLSRRHLGPALALAAAAGCASHAEPIRRADDARPAGADPAWTSAAVGSVPRSFHTTTVLGDGRVLLAGGDPFGAGELYDPRSGALTVTGAMTTPRYHAAATRLPSGKVLITGGTPTAVALDEPNLLASAVATAELYDPATGAFMPTGPMGAARAAHAATLLANGKVLITGGGTFGGWGGIPLHSAELYDPATGTFAPTAPMACGHGPHAAVALPSGQALIVGSGWNYAGPLPVDPCDSERYDPATGTFAKTGATSSRHDASTLTLLPSGKVLLIGSSMSPLSGPPVEIYDPATDAFSVVAGAPPVLARHAAALLPTGEVLLAGGASDAFTYSAAAVATVTIFDPTTSTFRPGPALPAPRMEPALTVLPSGKVLVTGGAADTKGHSPFQTAEVLALAAPELSASALLQERHDHTATPLATGEVLIAGGAAGRVSVAGDPDVAEEIGLASAVVFDPATLRLRDVGPMLAPRVRHAAARLATGEVLVVGGQTDYALPLATAEIYDPATGTFRPTAGSMATPHVGPTATLLGSGKVLVVGGYLQGMDGSLAAAELYDPATGTFQPAPSMGIRRREHTATLLDSGAVLVVGGGGDSFDPFGGALAALYFPWSNSTKLTAPTLVPRYQHTATKLPSGKVLIAGSSFPGGGNVQTEIFDPATEAFSAGPKLAVGRSGHAAALLPSGAVLISGGANVNSGGDLAPTTAELLDPAGATPPPLPLFARRWGHTATALGDGSVLLVGGGAMGDQLTPWTTKFPAPLAVERFLPATSTFTTGPSAAADATVTALPSGGALIAGGSGAPLRALRYDPATESFTAANGLAIARAGHTATLLASGKVLLAGGDGGALDLELHDPATATSTLAPHPLRRARAGHVATLLPSGAVLFTGGAHGDHAPAEIERFDPGTLATEIVATLHRPRRGHAASLLPSGRVLVAGGQDLAGELVLEAEIVDPVAHTSIRIPSPALPGKATSALLPTGEVLLAGDGAAHRYAEATGTFTPLPGAPTPALAAVGLLSGDALLFGGSGVALHDAATHTLGAARAAQLGVGSTGAARLGGGDALLFTIDASGRGSALRTRSVPRGAVRPVISSSPATLAPGVDLALSGDRFSRLSAAGSEALGPTPASAPLVLFMPAAGGGPLFGAVVSWTDTSLTFRLPPSSLAGPGFLHVVAAGVPSEGRFAALRGAPTAFACDLGATCASGFCVQGVCCEDACSGACMSCLGADHPGEGGDGTCAPAAAGTNPRGGCTPDPSNVCGRTGQCDGAGDCALAEEGTACGEGGTSGECSQGTCRVFGAACHSNLDCNNGFVCGANALCVPAGVPGPAVEVGCRLGPAAGGGGSAWAALGALAGAGALARRARGRRKGV